MPLSQGKTIGFIEQKRHFWNVKTALLQGKTASIFPQKCSFYHIQDTFSLHSTTQEVDNRL
ncbi:hypothetical protein D2S45_02545 [Prevotella intermedia]|uniref:Uncharacterized protein n=1 Tax=Prevotella intermedia TaxID=28131 RepID=A0A3R7XZ92_PREIN|nr:hypothetical protein D2S53_03470 [Prevotella intermedia]RRF88214.1 hypothetical protein D2S45_02545 [Prevotella intermedia]